MIRHQCRRRWALSWRSDLSTDQLARQTIGSILCSSGVTHAALRNATIHFAVANETHSRTISTASQKCPSRGAITTLDVIEDAVREEACQIHLPPDTASMPAIRAALGSGLNRRR